MQQSERAGRIDGGRTVDGRAEASRPFGDYPGFPRNFSHGEAGT